MKKNNNNNNVKHLIIIIIIIIICESLPVITEITINTYHKIQHSKCNINTVASTYMTNDNV